MVQLSLTVIDLIPLSKYMKKYLIVLLMLGFLVPSGAALAQTQDDNIIYEAMLNQVVQLQLKLIGMLGGLRPAVIPTSLDISSPRVPVTPVATSGDAWQWKYFEDQNVFLNIPTSWNTALDGLGNDVRGDEPTVSFSNNPGLKNLRVDYENCSRNDRDVEARRLTIGKRVYCAIEITKDDDDTSRYEKKYITKEDGEHIMISFEVEYNTDDNRRNDVADEAEELFDRVVTSATYGSR